MKAVLNVVQEATSAHTSVSAVDHRNLECASRPADKAVPFVVQVCMYVHHSMRVYDYATLGRKNVV